MRVLCGIEETAVENERGIEVPGTVATCSRCGHETESYGTSDASIKRCLALMREECPNQESNYYVDQDEY